MNTKILKDIIQSMKSNGGRVMDNLGDLDPLDMVRIFGLNAVRLMVSMEVEDLERMVEFENSFSKS